MVAYSHTITLSFKSTSGNTKTAAIAIASIEELNASVPVPANSAAYQLVMGINPAHLNDLLFLCDQPVTLKTNSSSSPINTFVLVAGVPFYWTVTSGVTNPITTTVTSIYVVNSNSSIANLDILVGQDPLP
jgi:hypothetical protein